MNNFGDRLREERERLGMSQEVFGAMGGVKKLAQFNYEKGDRSPDTAYMAAIAENGVDIHYLLTGEKKIEYRMLADLRRARKQLGIDEEPAVSGREVNENASGYSSRNIRLSKNFDLLDESGKMAVESMINALLTKK